MSGKLSVTLDASQRADGTGVPIQLQTVGKLVSGFKNGKRLVFNLPAFNYNVAPGGYYLATGAQLNGLSDSAETAAPSPVDIAAPFIDSSAVSLVTSKPVLVNNMRTGAKLTVQDVGNILLNETATVELFASESGALDGTQVTLAPPIPLKLKLKPTQRAVFRISFVPKSLAVGSSYRLIAMIIAPGDSDSVNNVALSVEKSVQ